MRHAVGGKLSPSGHGPVGSEAELQRRVMAALHDSGRASLVDWYASLMPSWLEVGPTVHRLLMLRVHRWIAERVLMPHRQGMPPVTEDLKAGGTTPGPTGSSSSPGEQANRAPEDTGGKP